MKKRIMLCVICVALTTLVLSVNIYATELTEHNSIMPSNDLYTISENRVTDILAFAPIALEGTNLRVRVEVEADNYEISLSGANKSSFVGVSNEFILPVGNTYAAYIKIEGAENNTHLYSEFVINSEGNIEITCNSWQEEKKNSLQLRGSGTIYEGTTGNDSMSTAIRTYHDYDNYGSLDSMTDEDWWVVSFDYDGIAAFWLGNIPTGCDYDLALWDDTGTARKYAANSGTTAEYMLYEVEADRNYYIQVHGWEGANDPDSMYWFRTKIYPCVEVEVTLHRQEAYNTCGCAAGKMVLGSLGINITETEFYAKNVELNGTQFDYVYAIKNTINYFLSSANKSFRYKYLQTNETTDSAQTILLENLANGYPVEMLIAIYSSNVTDETEYFPYLTNGHYVVLSGLYYDTVTETEMAIVYDSHDVYSDVYEVPLSALLLYNSNRSNYVICVEGE